MSMYKDSKTYKVRFQLLLNSMNIVFHQTNGVCISSGICEVIIFVTSFKWRHFFSYNKPKNRKIWMFIRRVNKIRKNDYESNDFSSTDENLIINRNIQ